MVRTYKEDDFQLLSPWEKAMRIADDEANTPVQTGKRMFRDIHSSLSICSEQKHLRLPPISEDPQKTIEFLGQEIGKDLVRSKRKVKIIKKELQLYDPLNSGFMSKTAAYEILKRYKLPPNDNYQRKIIAFFIAKFQPGKVEISKLVEFLENSFLQYKKMAEIKKREELKSTGRESKFNDSVHGRYDSEVSAHDREYEPRKAEAINKAFASRRDAGLSLEIERAFTVSGKDPHVPISRLEDAIQKTCVNERQEDLKLVNNMHLKGLVAKGKFPINEALILKCIDRLDPYNNGEIEWPRFIDFLRKAVINVPTNSQQPSPVSMHSSVPSTTLSNEKAPWESKKPLQNIKRKNSNDEDIEKFSVSSIHLDDTTSVPNYLQIEHPYQSYSNGNFEADNVSEQSFRSNGWDPYAQSKSILDYGNENHSEIDMPIYDDSYEDKMQVLNARGEVYRRVADALKDKSMFHEGMISTNDVRKTINYYNMLFDADINLEKVNSSLDKNSKNDYVDVNLIIDSFGRGII